ncbi:MAG: ABC-F family ATP-binding cassette domain-containing protein [Ruminococcaceae bacterium]|nr:ABC-F family ATP-binding cassette domain-containing protein [Oscillospiraceae bacterium]
MIDLAVSHLSKYYGAEPILTDVSFQLQHGEKTALVGLNGSGKTTLFRILAEDLDYDSGEVSIAKGLRVGLIQQIPHYPEGYTVEQVLCTGFQELYDLQEQMDRLQKRMEYDQTRETVRKYGELLDEFERRGGYSTMTELNKIANGLGISDSMRAQQFSNLSGGEKTRVNLACTMLQNADLLLLDEPTNHLDLGAIEWLEDYIKKYPGTVLIISHDRFFLDRCVDRVLELEDCEITDYNGNYSFYMAEKERRYLEQKKRYEAEQKKIAQLEFTAERLHGWGMGNKRLQVRAFAMEKRIERMRRTEKPKEIHSIRTGGFASREFHGDMVMQCKDLSHSFEERKLIDGVGFTIEKGDRIALIGDNGTGKTTLLKMFTGELTPDSGSIRFGPSVKFGLLPQVIEFDVESRNLVDTLIWQMKLTPESARNHLGAFDFRGEDVFSPVSTLSGGERSRLALCMLMAQKINFLILDEPTNHLDTASREWIEEAVADFDETLLFVSHDRYFINRFANRILALKDGKILDFRGNYEAYLRMLEQQKPEPEVVEKGKEEKARKRTVNTKAVEKKLREVEREIEKLEQKKAQRDALIAESASDFAKLQELYAEQETDEQILLELYTEWETLQTGLE